MTAPSLGEIGYEAYRAKSGGKSLVSGQDIPAFATKIQWTDTDIKWCTACKATHPRSEFGRDPSRGDGLAARCLASRRVTERKPRGNKPGYRHGWLVETRDGDKLQARRRINYLVEQRRIPHPDELPCFDCADMVFAGKLRHEYDHARGYDGENQLYVEAVCSKCHHVREETRRG